MKNKFVSKVIFKMSIAKETCLEFVLNKEKNREIFSNAISTLEEDDKDDFVWKTYQVVGRLLKCKENESNKEEYNSKLKSLLKNVKAKKVGWNEPIYDNSRMKREEHDKYLDHPFELSEGISECRKCGNKKVYMFAMQTRSGDEATTTFCRCQNCLASWKNN